MNLLGPMLLSSVFVGCVYGLVAVGYTILFRAGGILNFAQATLMVLAAFAMAMPEGIGMAVTVSVTVTVCGLLLAVGDVMEMVPV